MDQSVQLTPTDAELDVLKILWQHGPCTVRFVHERLNKKRQTGYTTTLKIMQIMFEKGIVIRNEESRTHIYEAMVGQDDIEKRLISKLMDSAFSGSASRLVMQVLGTRLPSETELKAIKKLIRNLENGEK